MTWFGGQQKPFKTHKSSGGGRTFTDENMMVHSGVLLSEGHICEAYLTKWWPECAPVGTFYKAFQPPLQFLSSNQDKNKVWDQSFVSQPKIQSSYS
ncbi:hypothetical protein MUK42_11523 [Musa troglodytarum]|uniref:Uncharacterized protein n=1 Tax=Musa troglodytarum TaxID=320322 RepID=A0A9E7KHG4_9LILI|nr:hypothetical protein MUK42_11523 [Musa troglodytarum]